MAVTPGVCPPSVSFDLKIASKEQFLAPMPDAVASGSTEAA